MEVFASDRIENNEGKGENADYQHCILFPHCLHKTSFPGIVW